MTDNYRKPEIEKTLGERTHEILAMTPEDLEEMRRKCYPVGSGALGHCRLICALIDVVASLKGYQLDRPKWERDLHTVRLRFEEPITQLSALLQMGHKSDSKAVEKCMESIPAQQKRAADFMILGSVMKKNHPDKKEKD